MKEYPFVQAKYYREGGNENPTRVVIHDMEMPERKDTAEACAAFFKRGNAAHPSSAHFCVDTDSVVQCVKLEDTAFHAPPNTGSPKGGTIGIEHAGYAHQGFRDWLDDYGIAMLRDVSAPLTASLCAEFGIPMVWLSVEDLKAGKHGVTSHNNVSLAFKKSTHTDPGPGFPVDQYMTWVYASTPQPHPVPPIDPEEDFMLPIIYIPVDEAGSAHDANGAPYAPQLLVQGNIRTYLTAIEEHDRWAAHGCKVIEAKPLEIMFLENQLTKLAPR